MEAGGVGVVGEDRRACGWCVLVRVACLGVELGDVWEDVLDDARDVEIGFQASQDAIADSRRRGRF
jgi:hypothetical protein